MAATRQVILGLFLLIILTLVVGAETKTFHAQETDLVKIKAEAVDPDNDQITYSYSPPLNDKGEWQTGYADAGEYEINVTASDGINRSVQKIRLIVDDKNRPPVITEKRILVQETQTVDLKEIVEDPDDDILSCTFHPPFDREGKWTTTYDDEGNYVTDFTVSDGKATVKGRVEIVVQHTNQPPQILETFSEEKTIKIKENEKLKFFIKAEDGDKDKLTYSWTLDGKVVSDKSQGEYYFDYESEGTHELKVVVSDGLIETSQAWTIEVLRQNRPPEVNLLPLGVQEGDKVVFDLPPVDQDGDKLTYTIGAPFNEKKEWQTSYGDAGTYKVKVTAFDGELKREGEAEITVLNTNRAPELNLPSQIEAKEGEESFWTIDSSDPDGDNLTIKLDGLPPRAVFDQGSKTVSWTPDYDTIRRTPGMVHNFLSLLGVEHYLLQKKSLPLLVTACDNNLCTAKKMAIVVYNTDRVPVLKPIDDVIMTETEKIKVRALATDPDGDVLRYSYSSPLGKRNGEWQTNYGDAGEYMIDVTASDGQLKSSLSLPLEVKKKNRPPSIKVEDQIVVLEGQEFKLSVKASDPDNDSLSLWLENITPEASFKEGVFTWKPGYDTVTKENNSWLNNLVSKSNFWNKKLNSEEKGIWLPFKVSDGEFETVHPVKVVVKNVNQKPEIISYPPSSETEVNVNEPTIFHVVAKDKDNDNLTYTWKFGWREDAITGTDTIERTFLTPGDKKVKVIISDGQEEVEKEWLVQVVKSAEMMKSEEVEEEKQLPFTIKVYVVEK